MICRSCGKEIADNAKFCNRCGSAIAAEPVVPPAAAPDATSAAKRKNPLLIVLIIVGAVLTMTIVLAVILVLCLYLYNKPVSQAPSMELESTQNTAPPSEGDDNPLSAGNPYREYFNPDGSNILPHSSDYYFTGAELQHYSREQLILALNEIYAHHDQRFSDPYLQEYFDNMPWYRPSNEELLLSLPESANVLLLQLMISQREGTDYTAFNPYFACCSAPQLLPDSSSRYLTADDLEKLSAESLVLARSEILARHGFVFFDPQLQTYFYTRDWYVPSVHESEFDAETLNDFETANIQLIRVYERIVAGDYAPAANNPYMPYFDPVTQLLLPESSTVALTEQDLRGYTKDQLIIIRNQIIALHGYTFSDQHLMEYFLQCSWYRPSTAPGRTDLVTGMSTVEYKNMDLISRVEANPLPALELDSLDTSLTYLWENDIYSVMLPAFWKDYAVIEQWYNEAGIPQVRFSEGPDNDKYDIGHLFTLKLQPVEDFYDYPQYSELGIISNGTNTYRFIILYPSDIQFSDENRELYSKMTGSSFVRQTLQLKNGYQFVN